MSRWKKTNAEACGRLELNQMKILSLDMEDCYTVRNHCNDDAVEYILCGENMAGST